jgi:hypothetical protein
MISHVTTEQLQEFCDIYGYEYIPCDDPVVFRMRLIMCIRHNTIEDRVLDHYPSEG